MHYRGSAARGEVEGAHGLAQVVHSRGNIHEGQHLAVAAQRILLTQKGKIMEMLEI